MKFGEQLGTHLTPEWRKQYIEYNLLKDIIYSGMESAPTTDSQQYAMELTKIDQLFFSKCGEELQKVNLFFSQKLAEAQQKFYELSHDLELYKTQHQKHAGGSLISGGREGVSGLIGRFRLRRVSESAGKESGGYQQTHLLKTAHQLKLAFSEYYLNLVLIQNYQQLNATGFRKILKKRDKLVGNNSGLEWRQSKVEKAPFFLTREIETLIGKTEQIVINELEGGDRTTGMKRLRVPPLNEKQSAWTTFRLGLYSGSFVVIVALLLFKVRDGMSGDGEAKWVGVRLFRGFLLFFLYLWLMGLNMYGWQCAGVNHVLIFEVNPRQHLTYQSLMEMGAFLCLIWSLAVLGFLFGPEIGCSSLIFPLILLLISVVWLLNPLRKPSLFQRSSRWWFIRQVFRCFTAPFHSVTFADFWLADQMNSFVTFFLDMEYFACFYLTEVQYDLVNLTVTAIPKTAQFAGAADSAATTFTSSSSLFPTTSLPTLETLIQGSNNFTTSGQIPLLNSQGGIEYGTGVDVCSSNDYGIRPLVSLIPALIRFVQCLRRFRDTKKRHPHLTNAGKYATSFFVVIIGALNTHYKTSGQGPLFYPWVIAYIISFVYTFTWDIKMDWGLMDLNSKNTLLRDELVYSSVFKYYAAMICDFVLRLGWVLNLSLGDKWNTEAETLLCITAPLECFRRFVWNYFRLENEHLNNCGQFRAVRDISVKPLRVGEVEELVAVMENAGGSLTHRGTGGVRKRRLKKEEEKRARANRKKSRKWSASGMMANSPIKFKVISTAPANLRLLQSDFDSNANGEGDHL